MNTRSKWFRPLARSSIGGITLPIILGPHWELPLPSGTSWSRGELVAEAMLGRPTTPLAGRRELLSHLRYLALLAG